MVVMDNKETCKQLLRVYHETLIARHLDTLKMLQLLARDYWWLNIRRFVQEYM